MKNNRGITLISLIMYILVVLMVLGMLSSLSEFIYGGLNEINTGSYSSEEFNKFNLNFIKDIKKCNSVNITEEDHNIQIVLSDNTNYNYKANEHSIYRNKVKIAENIKQFNAEKIVKNNKNVIKITIGTGKNSTQFGKTINYVLKYW